ncbi:hypothetical protein [Kordiimonas marina]|uniref:hypothetical protein n=1 Tax=Kordiimonas marina TaxID=2872312 RepID=UPI001FF62AE6|nr:hypothetical protein [Kordiimonas marina]MCJ9428972.1 hypothetical protein [Kordiimonas marina]
MTAGYVTLVAGLLGIPAWKIFQKAGFNGWIAVAVLLIGVVLWGRAGEGFAVFGLMAFLALSNWRPTRSGDDQ